MQFSQQSQGASAPASTQRQGPVLKSTLPSQVDQVNRQCVEWETGLPW